MKPRWKSDSTDIIFEYLRASVRLANDGIKFRIIRRPNFPISGKRKFPFIDGGGRAEWRRGIANGDASTCCAFLYVIVIRLRRARARAMSNGDGRSNLFESIYCPARAECLFLPVCDSNEDDEEGGGIRGGGGGGGGRGRQRPGKRAGDRKITFAL
jgi:hypothetical protein